jgi:hypothetical protein
MTSACAVQYSESSRRPFRGWRASGAAPRHRPRDATCQNAYVELCNGRLCDECLNENGFTNLALAGVEIERWR